MTARWFGRPRVGNCLLFVLCLLLRGRVRRMFRYKGHWMGVTRHGNVVHLKCLNKEDRDRRCPPWYRGRPHVLGRRTVRWLN